MGTEHTVPRQMGPGARTSVQGEVEDAAPQRLPMELPGARGQAAAYEGVRQRAQRLARRPRAPLLPAAALPRVSLCILRKQPHPLPVGSVQTSANRSPDASLLS